MAKPLSLEKLILEFLGPVDASLLFFLVKTIVAVFIAMAIRNYASQVLLYKKIKKSDYGKGSVYQIDGEYWILDEVTFEYVKFIPVDIHGPEGVLTRRNIKIFPLRSWERHVKTVVFDR